MNSSAPEHTSIDRFLHIGVFLLAFAIFAANLYAYRHTIIDDAYILFRYARNVADGHGFVFNPGGPTVEGFTSLLSVLLLVPAFRFGIDPYLAIRVISVLCVGCTVPALLSGYRRLVSPSVYRRTWPIPPFLFLAHYTTAYHAVLGLETMVFTALTIIEFAIWTYVFTRECRSRGAGKNPAESVSPATILAFFVVGFLAGLTRPEGFAVTLLWGSALLWRCRGSRRWIPGLAAFCALCAGYLIWKQATFGTLIPNSFFLKVAGTHGPLPGARYIKEFVLASGGLFACTALWILYERTWRRPLFLPLGIMGTLIFALAFYCNTLPLMAWEYRYFAPFMFTLFLPVSVFTGELFAAFLKRHGSSLPYRLAGYSLLVAALLLLLGTHTFRGLAATVRSVRGTSDRRIYDRYELHYRERELGERLGALGLGGDLSVAFWDSGAIPYFSDCRFIDLNGLNSSAIARAEDADEMVRIVMDESPDIIIFASRKPLERPERLAHTLYRAFGPIGQYVEQLYQSAKSSGYRYAGVFTTDFYDLHFLMNPSCAQGKSLMDSLGGILDAPPD